MKLIAVDVDGTLINSKNQISKKTKDTLIKAAKIGNKIVIVSGRPAPGLRALAKELEFDKFHGLLSSNNGSTITDFASGEIIADHFLDMDLARKILKESLKIDLEIVLPHGDILISDKNHKYLDHELRLLKLQSKIIPDVRENLSFKINKILFSGEPEKVDKYYPFLEKNYGEITSQVRSHPYNYEVMPKGLSKGASLLEIANFYQIKKEDIIAFGDELNDLTMIESAGVGVAMANAVDTLKEIADYITLSNDEDGIAYYLDRFVL